MSVLQFGNRLSTARLTPAFGSLFDGAITMIRLGSVGLLALAIAMAITNPNQDSHKKTVYATMHGRTDGGSMLGNLAGAVLSDLDLVPYQYHNYVVFSTMTFQDDLVSVGALNKVWPTGSD